MNSVKIHIFDAKNSRTEHDLPTSVNGTGISSLREGFIFGKFRENKTLAKISDFTVYNQVTVIDTTCGELRA